MGRGKEERFNTIRSGKVINSKKGIPSSDPGLISWGHGGKNSHKLGEKTMDIRHRIRDMMGRVFDGYLLKKDEILYLLGIDLFSIEAGFIMAAANILTRKASQGKAEVHAQIGLNLSLCPNNCSFCAFSAENRLFKDKKEMGGEEVHPLRFTIHGMNPMENIARYGLRWRKKTEQDGNRRREQNSLTENTIRNFRLLARRFITFGTKIMVPLNPYLLLKRW